MARWAEFHRTTQTGELFQRLASASATACSRIPRLPLGCVAALESGMRIDRSQTDEQIYFREGFGIEYFHFRIKS